MRVRSTKSLLVLAALLPLGACTGGRTSSPSSASPTAAATTVTSDTTTPATSTSATTSAAGRTITVTVTGTRVVPDPGTVQLKVGETLTLVVTSDHDDELHAHGFEVELPIRLGPTSRRPWCSRAALPACTRWRCTTQL